MGNGALSGKMIKRFVPAFRYASRKFHTPSPENVTEDMGNEDINWGVRLGQVWEGT